MRFKNYSNEYNKSNGIMSEEDFLDTPLRTLFDNEQAILAQHRRIGLPTNAELEASPNVRRLSYENGDDMSNGSWESIGVDDLSQNDTTINNHPLLLEGNISMDYYPKDYNQFSLEDYLDMEEEPINNTPEVGQTPVLNGGISMNYYPNVPKQSSAQIQAPPKTTAVQIPKQTIPGAINKNIDSYNITPDITHPMYSNLGLISKLNNAGLNSQIKQDSPELRRKKISDKYRGLTLVEKLAKGTAKIPTAWTAQQYYGHAMHLADGEEPSLYMKLNNDFYRFGDLPEGKQKDFYRQQAAKMYKFDLNDPLLDEKIKNAPIVISKPGSSLSKKIKNSKAFKDYVVEHYGELINEIDSNGFIEFPFNKNLNLYTTIHKGDLTIPAKSSSAVVNDLYNFEEWDKVDGSYGTRQVNWLNDGFEKSIKQHVGNLKQQKNNWMTNRKADLNNLGFAQQEAGQLADYILTSNIQLTQNDIKKIMREYQINRLKSAK